MKISRRDFLKLSGAAVLASAFTRISSALADPPTPAPIISHGSRRHRYVALTYDDCNLVTELHVLEDILSGYPDVRMTLFPIGEKLLTNEAKDPGIWKRFYSKGHEIGYHSWDHTSFGVMSPTTAIADYDKWQAALVQVMGFLPNIRFARPPYGILSYSLDVLCRERNLVTAMWSAAGGGETAVVFKNTFQKIQNGDIVLFHTRNTVMENYVSTDMDTTREAIPYLIGQNMGMVTLSKLYDDLLQEENQSSGCDISTDESITRTCFD